MAEVPEVLVVGAVVDEDPQRLADLVGGEADALGGVHGCEQVLHEAGQFGAEIGDLRAGCVQERVSVQGEGSHVAVGAGDGAVSHGGKSKVPVIPRLPHEFTTVPRFGSANGSR
ncbi:hypothetical protein GCM10010244_25540 [Streptomyces coeruleorubidus]|nr:hypothetical protein GCM10010244_25540 [Streptomyces bellus]